MKNIIKTLSLLTITAVFFASCESNDNPTFNADGDFVQLATDDNGTTPNGFVLENSPNPIVTSFILDGPKTNDVVIEFEVTSDDPSRFMVVSGTSITVPAGETSGEIVIQPIDNFNTDGDAQVVVALSTSNTFNIGVAGDGNFSVSRTITISDDDCPIAINDFVGLYNVSEVFSAGGTNAGLTLVNALGRSFLLEFSLNPNDATGTQVIINTPAGFDQFLPNGTVLSFLTCTAEFELDSNPIRTGDFANQTLTTTSYVESSFTLSGSGPLGNFGAYEWVLTKQ